MGAVYLLTLRQLSGRWRLLVLTVLASLPVLIALMALSSREAPSVGEFEVIVFGGMLAGSIAPLVVLAIAAVAFANEVEDRTLANLILAPLPRWQIVVPKLLASISIAGPFIAVSAFVTSYVAFLGDLHAALAVTGAALIGVALYASAFVWLGLVTTQAVGIGLLYIVVWEGFFSGFVAGVRLLSIRYYTIGLMRGFDARRFVAADDLSFGVAAAASVLVFGGFLWLSIRRLRRMDVP
jgi:ABC-2 type transport system permease protein